MPIKGAEIPKTVKSITAFRLKKFISKTEQLPAIELYCQYTGRGAGNKMDRKMKAP
ncbi:hypothetical protein BSBH6_00555 [Bacillus subtilis]|nr:hypothetical protein BSBH6_00555 [Bacillus subtilis]RPK26918.1 hypothetical protein BH5_00553 [Bacillus subtilis]